MPGNALTSRLLLTVCAPALALLMLALLVICVLMPGSETARAQGSPEKDRQLLSGLYLALGGPGWTNSDNWLGDKPLGQWHGVTTDAQGRVTGLDLSGNGLTGAIPPGLSVLFDPSAFDIRLKELDLSDNGLSGQLPLGFVPLFPHLEVLKASGNQFRGPIPSDVSSLSKLTWLDLDNNHLSGRIPAGLGSLSNLTVLRLGGNDFSGPIPAELGQLSKLSILGLGNNRLSGRMPAELGRLASLTRLSVWGNELEGPIPSELGRLSKLTKLSLGNNSLSGDVPEQLGNLGKLEELSLSGNPGLTGCAPDGLKGRLDMSRSNLGGLPFCSEVGAAIDRAALEAFYHATRGASWKNKTNWLNDDAPLSSWHGVTTDSDGRVTRLVLFDNNLSGEIPAELGNLLNLKELRLENNSLKGGIPTELGYLVNLQWLWLQGNQLSGEIPGILGSLVKMDGMGLANNQLKGEIPAEFGNLVNLKELYLQGNQLSGEIPAELGDLAKLQWLYLYENQLRGEVPEELGKLANLVELKFGDNQLSGEIPPELGDLVNLEWLGLLNNQLSGEIPAELGKLTNLVTLYLEGNRLSGCLPRVLLKYQLNTNLSRLGGLPFCGDAPMLFSDWHLIGSASRTESGSALLTPAKTWQLGGILYPQPISAEDFTIRFSFEITGTEIRADGIVLTVAQDFPDDERINQARAGGRFGLEMFTRGIAVEFDSFNNSWETSANHVAVSRMGKEITDRPVHLASTDLDVDLRNSGVYEAEVVFDNGRFEVFLSNLDQGMEKTLLLEYTVPELAPYDEFYLGLLASTGGDTDRHIIHNVYLSQGEGPVVPAPTPTPPTPTPTPPPGVGQEADRAVLEALYNATGGANWRRKANWLDDDAPLSKWQGVTTDSGGRVTELRLSENELKGELPAELGNLDNLRFLNLQGNQLGNIAGMGHPGGSLLSSGIPAELGNLSSLVTLNLRDNNLSGKIPAELSKLDSLKWLYLSGNSLSGEIPAELGDLANLRLLHIHNNQLSGEIPTELGKLARLKWLYLSGNDLSGCVPGSLQDRLKNMGKDIVDSYLGGLPFCGAATPPPTEDKPDCDAECQIQEGISRDYNGLSALFESMDAKTDWDAIRSEKGGCYFGTDTKRPLGQWCGVTTNEDGRVIKLELGGIGAVDGEGLGIGLNGTIPAALGSMDELRVLDLSDGKVCGGFGCSGGLSGWIPGRLGFLPKLEALDLSGNELSGYAPSKLAEFPNLTVLNLSHNALSGGATELLENGYEGSDGSDELITIDLSNNPWTYEPDQYQSYWKEFEAEVTRGFVDLTTTVLQKRYPILSVNDRTSLMGYLNKRAQGETRQAIKARAIEHIAKKGAWKTSATLLVKGMTLVGTVGSGIGWVVFTIEVANILHGVLDAAVEVLQRGPGTLIKETSDSVLGIYDACLLGKGYYDAPTKTSEQKAAIEAECKNR